MKTVQVTWRDSNQYFEQCKKDLDFEVSVLQTIGFLISEDKTKLVLSGDLVDEEDCRRIIVIPKENIVNRSDL